jgi:Tfp pilus assembly protein PilO
VTQLVFGKINLNQAASPREQLLFGLILVALLVGLLFGLASSPLRELGGERSQLQALESEKKLLKKFLEATPSVYKTFTSRPPEGVKFKVLLGEVESSFEDVPLLLKEITALPFLKGVHVEGVSYQPETSEVGFTRSDFVLEVAGTFTEIVNYLESLEDFPALFQIKDLVLSLSEVGAGEVKAQLSCRFFKKAR